MGKIEIFYGYIKKYFRGLFNAEYREIFIMNNVMRERMLVFYHGLENILRDFIKRPGDLRKYNLFMGVGYTNFHGLLEPELDKMLYDRIVYDFDSKDDPNYAVRESIVFAKKLEEYYDTTPLVFISGFKGAHIVIPLSNPVSFDVYKIIWKKLLDNVVDKKLVDYNMLQWNRVDRIPLTYNVKDQYVKYCRIIYPEEFRWETFDWKLLKPLDPSRVRIVKIEIPRAKDPVVLSRTSRERQWIWKIVETGLKDGRKRFLFHVLIPYLIHSGFNENKIMNICLEFINKSCENHNNCDKIYLSWIKSAIKSAKSRGFYGFGLNKLKEKDPELYSIIIDVLKNEKT